MTTPDSTSRRAPLPTRPRADRIFYPAMTVAIAFIVFVGFRNSFFLRAFQSSAAPQPLPPVLVIHGALFTSWVVLLMVQTGLVRSNRRRVHKTLGLVAMALAAAMVPSGVMAGIDAVHRGSAPVIGGDARVFLAQPVGGMILFAAFTAAGFWRRHDAETHKRLMLVATIGLTSAAFGRIVLHSGMPWLIRGGLISIYGLVVAMVVIAAAYDYATRRRVHQVYLWGGIVLAAEAPICLAIGRSEWWLALASRLIA